MHIDSTVNADHAAALRQHLRDVNTAASPAMAAIRSTEADDETPIHLWAYGDAAISGTQADFIGGMTGHMWAKWLHINFLWVDPAYQRRGIGAALVREAEQLARERGCVAARVETWDFQAPEFYKKQGFQVVGTIEGYPEGAVDYTLVKRFT